MTLTQLTLRIPGGITLTLLTVSLPAKARPSIPPTAASTIVETEGTELPSTEPMPIRSCRSNVIHLRKSA